MGGLMSITLCHITKLKQEIPNLYNSSDETVIRARTPYAESQELKVLQE